MVEVVDKSPGPLDKLHVPSSACNVTYTPVLNGVLVCGVDDHRVCRLLIAVV